MTSLPICPNRKRVHSLQHDRVHLIERLLERSHIQRHNRARKAAATGLVDGSVGGGAAAARAGGVLDLVGSEDVVDEKVLDASGVAEHHFDGIAAKLLKWCEKRNGKRNINCTD